MGKFSARIVRFTALALMLISCATTTYIPPTVRQTEEQLNSSVVDKSYDEVWDSLIDYVSEHLYVITTIEKDSGIISASWRTENPGNYLDCGHLTFVDKSHPGKNYNGPYADLITEISGQVNISVKAITDQKTRIRVNTRYILNGGAFDTGGVGTTFQDVPDWVDFHKEARICQSNYHFETSIIKAVSR